MLPSFIAEGCPTSSGPSSSQSGEDADVEFDESSQSSASEDIPPAPRQARGPVQRPFRQQHPGTVSSWNRHSSNHSNRNNRRPQNTMRLQQPPTIPAEWAQRKNVLVILADVPVNASPWDLKQFFGGYGNVVYVELDESPKKPRAGKVRFEPPPRDTSFIQNGRCKILVKGTPYTISVHFPPQVRYEANTIKSPLGNVCAEKMELVLDKFVFGLLTEPMVYMGKKEIPNAASLSLKVDFKRKKLVVNFPLKLDESWEAFRIEIKFGVIQHIYRMDAAPERTVLVLTLVDSPLFWKRRTNEDGSAWADRTTWEENEMWCRAVNVIDKNDKSSDQKPVSLDEYPNTIDFGRWTTYWIELSYVNLATWFKIEHHLRDWNIKTRMDAIFTQTPNREPELRSILRESDVVLSVQAASSWAQDLAALRPNTTIFLPFDVRYQLEVCISQGILCEYSIGREFLEKLLELSNPASQDPQRARLVLEYAADMGKKIWSPMELLTDVGALTYYPPTLRLPHYCALVRKVMVTPTKIIFNTATVETTNRVIRHYWNFQDYFMRIQFTDEQLEGRVRGSDADRDDDLYTRVYRVLFWGIRMGKWHWKFLAFGNSQIRENGAFMFCQPDRHVEDMVPSCDEIRRWMGDFEHIKVVAKYAARLGQCFSTTRVLRGGTFPPIVEIEDVNTENGKFCFTDGVGRISTLLARLVAEDWQAYPPPSAYQFRMGGCKGVLVDWKHAKGTEVHIRPSQEKFSAAYNGLEVVRCSSFSCATLNRQTITILSALGVPDHVFVDLMREQLSKFDAAMTDGKSAVDMLTSYVDENMTTISIARMIGSGFMESDEPFVKTILQLWRSWSLKTLKEKAKLAVEKGAFVLGCVDETGTLRGHSKATEGWQRIPQDQLPQIFLQIPDPDDPTRYKVITGLCIIGRNPSLHPGDIRVVEAVDVPALRHLRDVVVFPLKGDRDVPSMCSGGDLDGDDFFVIWDEKLLPTEWSHPPMDHTPQPPVTGNLRKSVVESLSSFFVLFMKNDRLPFIAHAHLATADAEPEGAKSEKCLKLAEMHSIAVDYVKTGVPAQWSRKLSPRSWPHFMEKQRGSYHSKTALGQLYDMVHTEDFDSTKNYQLPFDRRILTRYMLDQEVLKTARKIKTQYDIAMRRILGMLEIRTEFEVWTGFVMSKPRVGSDYKVQEKVGREAAALKEQFRAECIKAAGDRDFEKLGPFVAAMYQVTCEEMRIALYQACQPHILLDGTTGIRRITARSMPLVTFPWLFPGELGRLATGRENDLIDLGMGEKLRMPRIHEVVNRETLLVADDTQHLDLRDIDYSQTADGRIVHRGEIVHFFQHDDGDRDGQEVVPRLETEEGKGTPASEQPPDAELIAGLQSPVVTPGEQLLVPFEAQKDLLCDDDRGTVIPDGDLLSSSPVTGKNVGGFAGAGCTPEKVGRAGADLISVDDAATAEGKEDNIITSPMPTHSPRPSIITNTLSRQGQKQKPTPPTLGDFFQLKTKEEEEEEDGDEDEEVEYEEVVVVLKEGTALEKLARFL
ncbi:putative RNA-dependent RNA polymerase [Triangularia setosa]|uniref:RNA-dependent RNA polymerase n=1 Tax=Triangularia setosa TaxID=2587417 RepID=A0AAN6WID6_9PEZI|nr:putative RNA-dependent RNA polymerase [Podospora setosa]